MGGKSDCAMTNYSECSNSNRFCSKTMLNLLTASLITKVKFTKKTFFVSNNKQLIGNMKKFVSDLLCLPQETRLNRFDFPFVYLLKKHCSRYNVAFLVITYLVPILSMTYTYARIGIELWGSQSIGECTQRQMENIKSKRRVSQYLLHVWKFYSYRIYNLVVFICTLFSLIILLMHVTYYLLVVFVFKQQKFTGINLHGTF